MDINMSILPPSYFPNFNSPVYTIDESMSIRPPHKFHELMNATRDRLLEQGIQITKQTLPSPKISDILLTNGDEIITEYLTIFIDNVILEMQELKDKQYKSIYNSKLFSIVKVFLNLVLNLIYGKIKYYKFDTSNFKNFAVFEVELIKCMKLLRITINVQKGKYVSESNEIYFLYVRLYNFMYNYIFTTLESNKAFEHENLETFNATVKYIFDNDL